MPIRLRLFLSVITLFATLMVSPARADQIPLLIAALNEEGNRQGASLALAKLGKAAVPALRKSLRADQPDVRVWAAFTLGEIGPQAKNAVGDLIQQLDNADPAFRMASAQALGKIGSEAAVDALTKSLEDKETRVQNQAAIALGQIGKTTPSTTLKLVKSLEDHRVRFSAREALIRMGKPTGSGLLKALANEKTRFDACFILRKIDPIKAKQEGLFQPTPNDLPSLKLVFQEETRSAKDRKTAAGSLAKLGTIGQTVLIEAFGEPQIARTAAEAFAGADVKAVPLLKTALSDDSKEVRATTAEAVGHMGSRAGDAAEELTKLLKDEDRNVRYQAVRALHELGPKAKPAISALSKVIQNPRELEPTRQWAIKTLIMTLPETHEAVVKALIAACDEKANYGVRQLARQQLLLIDKKAAESAGIR